MKKRTALVLPLYVLLILSSSCNQDENPSPDPVVDQENKLPRLKGRFINDESSAFYRSESMNSTFRYSGNSDIPETVSLSYCIQTPGQNSCTIRPGGYLELTSDAVSGKILSEKYYSTVTGSQPALILSVDWQYNPNNSIKTITAHREGDNGEYKEDFYYNDSGQLDHSICTWRYDNPSSIRSFIRDYAYGDDGNVSKIEVYNYFSDVGQRGLKIFSEEHRYDDHPAVPHPFVYHSWNDDFLPIPQFSRPIRAMKLKNNMTWSKFIIFGVDEVVTWEFEVSRTYEYNQFELPSKETVSYAFLRTPHGEDPAAQLWLWYPEFDGTVTSYTYDF